MSYSEVACHSQPVLESLRGAEAGDADFECSHDNRQDPTASGQAAPISPVIGTTFQQGTCLDPKCGYNKIGPGLVQISIP